MFLQTSQNISDLVISNTLKTTQDQRRRQEEFGPLQTDTY